MTFYAKVGQSVSPYASDFQSTGDTPGAGAQTFVHVFTSAGGDASAGIAFIFSAPSTTATLCIADVQLRQILSAGGP